RGNRSRSSGCTFRRRTAHGVRSVSPRSPHRAAASSRPSALLIVHPFHVLFGRRVLVLFAKRRAGRLVFVCEGGPLGRVTVPESWTERGPAPAAHRLSIE